MLHLRVRFTVATMMVVVAASGIALGSLRLSRLEFLHAYEMSFLGLVGLSPILTCYLWLRPSRGRGPSVPVEVLIRRFAVILAAGFLFWAIIILWADAFY